MKTNPMLKDLAKIEAAAAEWLVRRGNSARSVEQDDEFYAWLEANPCHGDVYDELAQTLEDIGHVKGLSDLSGARRSVWAGSRLAAAACLALAAALLFLPLSRDRGEGFATGIAETRIVSLTDGSRITLGADSSITADFDGGERRVVLEKGQAFFDVTHDASRPFYVKAGGTLVRVVGTKFDIRRGDEGVRVSVEEGRVEVRDGRALTLTSPAMRVLTAGQGTTVQEGPAYIAIAAIPPPVEPAANAGAWRDGRLAYDDVRLAEVVADINRYYEPGVRLETPDAGEVRVTTAFRVNEIPAFLDALAVTLPVTVLRDGKGAYLLSFKER